MNRVISSRASSRARDAALPIASEGVIYVNVAGRSVPVAQQALYDAADEIRLATEVRVGWRGCVSAVAVVLATI